MSEILADTSGQRAVGQPAAGGEGAVARVLAGLAAGKAAMMRRRARGGR